MRTVLGIDIGGTKIAAGLVDSNGTVSHTGKIPTVSTGTGADLAESIADLARKVLAEATEPVDGVGIGCASPMSWPAGEVAPVNIPCWRGYPLRAHLERALEMTTRIHNDAICVAAAENWVGAGRGCDDMLGVVVSTGVGGGLILGGHILNGGTGNAGHIGHIVVEPDGPECVCGNRGCVEVMAQGSALTRYVTARGWTSPDGQEATPLVVEQAARSGDPIALAAFESVGRALGMAFAHVAVINDIDLIVVGGGVSKAGELLLDPVRRYFAEFTGLEYAKRTAIVRAELDQEAGIIGAAALLLGGDRYWTAR